MSYLTHNYTSPCRNERTRYGKRKMRCPKKDLWTANIGSNLNTLVSIVEFFDSILERVREKNTSFMSQSKQRQGSQFSMKL